MKKHLVMIVGNYYPAPSPTGKCADAYIELLRDWFDISVVCIAETDCKPFCFGGKQVYPAADAYTLLQHRMEKKQVPRLLQNAAKVPVHVFQYFVHPNNLYGYVGKAQKQLEVIHDKRPVDVIFSVGAPMAAHVAAWNFRRAHLDVRWVTYTVDSYAAQNKRSRRYVQALAFEASVLGASDRVLLSEEIYENSPALYQDFSQKCETLPYLMPPTPVRDESKQYFTHDKINLVYAGRFYKDIRNPEYLLRLILEMDGDCILHLFCQSDCDSLIDDYVRRSNGRIVRHKPVSVDEIQKIYAEADILVSVGNNTPEFKPSKIFEYIASGKPIINIYYPGLRDELLDRSALTLQLQRCADPAEDAVVLRNFVAAARNQTLTREQIEKHYWKHSSENILRILQSAVATE